MPPTTGENPGIPLCAATTVPPAPTFLLLKVAIEKSGIKTSAIEPAERPWPALVRRLRDYAGQPRADHPDGLPALIYADFGDATMRHDKHVRTMSAAVLTSTALSTLTPPALR